jgi:hypothetical protein
VKLGFVGVSKTELEDLISRWYQSPASAVLAVYPDDSGDWLGQLSVQEIDAAMELIEAVWGD